MWAPKALRLHRRPWIISDRDSSAIATLVASQQTMHLTANWPSRLAQIKCPNLAIERKTMDTMRVCLFLQQQQPVKISISDISCRTNLTHSKIIVSFRLDQLAAEVLQVLDRCAESLFGVKFRLWIVSKSVHASLVPDVVCRSSERNVSLVLQLATNGRTILAGREQKRNNLWLPFNAILSSCALSEALEWISLVAQPSKGDKLNLMQSLSWFNMIDKQKFEMLTHERRASMIVGRQSSQFCLHCHQLSRDLCWQLVGQCDLELSISELHPLAVFSDCLRSSSITCNAQTMMMRRLNYALNRWEECEDATWYERS